MEARPQRLARASLIIEGSPCPHRYLPKPALERALVTANAAASTAPTLPVILVGWSSALRLESRSEGDHTTVQILTDTQIGSLIPRITICDANPQVAVVGQVRSTRPAGGTNHIEEPHDGDPHRRTLGD